MRALVTGGAGTLGDALRRSAPADVEVHATYRRAALQGPRAHRVDLADAEAAHALIGAVAPDVVVHAAYAKDNPERDIVAATRHVASACRATAAALVHVSTDALLAGDAAPYDESATPHPVYSYGRAKASAEQAVTVAGPADAAIVRTSLLLAPRSPIVCSLLDWLRADDPPPLFTDELRCPIAADDLAAQLWELTRLPRAGRAGVWNLVGPEAVSRYTLAVLVAARAGLDPGRLRTARSIDQPSPRPRDLRMTTGRADQALAFRPRPASAVLATYDLRVS